MPEGGSLSERKAMFLTRDTRYYINGIRFSSSSNHDFQMAEEERQNINEFIGIEYSGQ
jgi:hypothetical protein